MNTNNTIPYPQIQAIEPTENMQHLAKKSGKYTTLFLIALVSGVLISLTVTPIVGVPLTLSAFIFGFMSAKLAPQAQILNSKNEDISDFGSSIPSGYDYDYANPNNY